jgi:phosphoglycolate phosphatase-like HAD superfamily hydrolase
MSNSSGTERYFIFDIDGTLADCSHRLPLIDRSRAGGPNWDAFFAACDKDTPIEPVIEVAKDLLAEGYQIIYLTGRPFSAMLTTSAWLRAQGLPGSPIIMRADGDHRPDTEVKREHLGQLIENDTEIVGVFEDSPSVCRVWRELGLIVFQVGSGEEF